MIRTKLIKALLSLIASLMVGNAWGQTTILAAGNRDTVHTRTEIIYVEENASRELYLPELRINDGVADASYQWYVHWYISKDSPSKGKIEKPTKAIYLDADAAKSRGGDINGGYYASDLRDAENGGLWWYKGFYDVTKYETSTDNKTIWKQLSSCASTIVYTAPESLSKADTLFCDVSSYTNFDEDELNDGGGTFTEPTLLKRYKYIIRPASECANALKEGPLEKYEIDYPAETDITLTPVDTESIIPVEMSGLYEGQPELELLKKQSTLAEKQKKMISQGYIPSLSLTGSFMYSAFTDKAKNWFHDGPSSKWYNSSGIGLTLRVPIFDGLDKRSKIQKAKLDIENAKLSYDNALKSFRTQYLNATNDLMNSRRNFTKQKDNYLLAEDVYEVTSDRYREGVASMTEVLQDEMRMSEAQNNYVTAHYNYRVNNLTMLKLTGKLETLLK